jgi:hypothetical protein
VPLDDERLENPGAAAEAVVDVWKELVYQVPGANPAVATSVRPKLRCAEI